MDLWPDTLAAPAVVTWDGNRWRLHDDGYYRYSKRGLLHRAVYTAAHGTIPDTLHVHHRDHNRLNNHPGNLTAQTPAEHWAEHHDERGPDWHSRGGHATWRDRPHLTYTCRICGNQFTSRATSRPEFCSGRCREQHYAATGTGRTYEERVCIMCGNTFRTKARASAETCNRSCTARLAYRRRSPGL